MTTRAEREELAELRADQRTDRQEHNIPFDLTAKGLAREAIQAFRSHDQVDIIRFAAMDKKLDEIVGSIKETNIKIEKGFDKYDAKFWSLAVTIIVMLAGCLATILFEAIFKH